VGPKDFRCPEDGCDSRFRVRRTLLDHLRKHRGIYEYSCDQCGKICTTKHTLKDHMIVHLNGQIICHICTKVFQNKARLGSHISRTHATLEQKTRFKCDQCEKAYPTSLTLNRHMVSHTGVRNFTCLTCEKKYMSKRDLTHHEKVHSGIKSFQCKTCEKPFRTGNKLRRHEVIHTQEMKFNCSLCGKGFNQRTNKNAHENKCNALNEQQNEVRV